MLAANTIKMCLKTYDFKRKTIFEKKIRLEICTKKSASKFNDMQDEAKKFLNKYITHTHTHIRMGFTFAFQRRTNLCRLEFSCYLLLLIEAFFIPRMNIIIWPPLEIKTILSIFSTEQKKIFYIFRRTILFR